MLLCALGALGLAADPALRNQEHQEWKIVNDASPAPSQTTREETYQRDNAARQLWRALGKFLGQPTGKQYGLADPDPLLLEPLPTPSPKPSPEAHHTESWSYDSYWKEPISEAEFSYAQEGEEQ